MSKGDLKDFITIINEERDNFKVTADHLKRELEYADKVLFAFENLTSNLKEYPRELTPILQMYWICLRGYIISSQLMFQAHLSESYAIISRSAEAVASARKMHMNPEKIPEWIKAEKDTDQPFRRILGKLFPEEDKLIYPKVFDIYETMSEYGRHPSFKSTIHFTDTDKMDTENIVDFTVSDFGDEVNLKRNINYLIYAHIEFLLVFKTIFEKFLSKKWIDEFNQIQADYNKYKAELKMIL